MQALTHLGFSVLLGLLLQPALQGIGFVLFMIGCIAGGVLPDIDLPKSRIGKRFKVVSWILYILLGHRGIMHSLWALILLLAVYAAVWPNALVAGLVVGFLSHLILDSITRKGIVLLPPLQLRMRGPLVSGGISEQVLFGAIVVVGLLLLMVI